MADHAKPILTDNYTDVLSQIRGRFEDQAKGFDPASTSATNIATGTIRWTSASNNWQKWSGTAWTDLSSLYAINISGNAATATNASTVTNGVYTVGDQTIAGVKTFSSTIQGSISGNAGTVTNGVYTTGDQTINGVKTFSSNTIFNGNLGIGTSSPSNQLDISNSNDPSASFYRTSNSPGVGIGRLIWDGQNSSGSRSTYARIQAEIVTNTAGSHTGQLIFSTATGGALTNKMTLDANGKLILSAANQGIQFADGTTQTSAAINPATASAGAVGTYAMLKFVGSGSVLDGSTVSGTNLRYTNAAGTTTESGGFPTGTWKAMGFVQTTSDATRTTLWLRIS